MKYSYVFFPSLLGNLTHTTCEYALYGKRDSANVKKVKELEMGRLPGQNPSNHMNPCKWRTLPGWVRDAILLALKIEKSGHEPRKAGNHQTEKETESTLRAPEVIKPANTMILPQ